jgi:hypothetical protein
MHTPVRTLIGRRPVATLVGLVTACLAVGASGTATSAHRAAPSSVPHLAGRAVLPAEIVAPGPPSGSALVPAGATSTTINGIAFPRPGQPVAGFSAVVDGRRPGELLAMPDNGFGGKANSTDFLIRAYFITPDYTTRRGGSGGVDVGEFVQFADPGGLIGFPIVREGTPERWLTGGDIDPESLQRDHRGHLWVGDEFGPWILHFDDAGRLLEAPIPLPDGLVSPSDPTRPPTISNSRGIEAMAIHPSGRTLIVILEGAVPGDDPSHRRVYRYDMLNREFSRLDDYVVDVPGHFVSDAQAIDDHRLLVVERDGGRGLDARLRRVFAFDLERASKAEIVDLAAIPDPDLVSLPPLHPGDVGLGDPFRVTCESVEALHVTSRASLVVVCDNNLPNTGRNSARADDTELIVVAVPGLRARGG